MILIVGRSFRGGMRREIELLACCSVEEFGGSGERIKALTAERLDWQYFLRLALSHRVLPLVYRNLLRHAPDNTPSRVIASLRHDYHSNLTHNLLYKDALLDILAACREADIPVLCYKGPVHALLGYGDLALRQFNDLDLLIHEEDLGKMTEVLLSQGYSLQTPHTSGWVKFAARYLRDVSFVHRSRRVTAEVQWRIPQRYHPVLRWPGLVWKNPARVNIDDNEVQTLSVENTLLVLCLHGLYHSWEQLQMVNDVASFLRRAHPDWNRVFGNPALEGGERILLLGLVLAGDLLEAPLPDELIQKASQDRLVRGAARDIILRFFADEPFPKKTRRFFFLEARLFRGGWSKVRYFLGRLLTPNDEDLVQFRLPPRLVFLHHLFRLVRLFRKYFLRA